MLIVLLVLVFGTLGHYMGGKNLVKTIMATAHDLLLNTVFFLMGITVLAGALSKLLSEFGVVQLLEKLLRPLMKPIYNLPGVSAIGAVMTFLSDNPAIIALSKDRKFASYFKKYQLVSLTNFGTAFGMGLVVILTMVAYGQISAALVGLFGAVCGSIISTRLMQKFTLKGFPELSAPAVEGMKDGEEIAAGSSDAAGPHADAALSVSEAGSTGECSALEAGSASRSSAAALSGSPAAPEAPGFSAAALSAPGAVGSAEISASGASAAAGAGASAAGAAAAASAATASVGASSGSSAAGSASAGSASAARVGSSAAEGHESVFMRFLNAILDGGKNGVDLGLQIIPGVLIITTFVLLVTFDAGTAGVYNGSASQGVPILPWLAGKIHWLFEWLFGFEDMRLLAFPMTALGAVGAALGLLPSFSAAGILDGNAIAVCTAIGMCWSGYLSTHTAMLDSLGYRGLISKAIGAHTIAGFCAGVIAHFTWLLVALL